jgi:predicted outer membrane repeat protein
LKTFWGDIKMNERLIFSLLLIVVLFPYTSCPAATYYVDDALGLDSNPGTALSPKKTIIGGIYVASDYDTVIVMDGTYQGENNREIGFSGKAITLVSNDGPGNCIIDAQSQSRVFYMYKEDPDLVIEGFTITGGLFTDLNGGGGMWMAQSDITVKSCVFTQNTGYQKGGAIGISSSSSIIQDCIIENNTSGTAMVDGHGGGISIISSPAPGVKIINCTIRNNVCAGIGGGLFNDNGQITIIDSLFYGNQAYEPSKACSAGAMYLEDGTQIDIINTRFIDNYAKTHAGAIYCQRNAQVNLTNVLFEHNVALGTGGALYNGRSMTNIDNCTFAYNSAGGNGGAIHIYSLVAWDSKVISKNSVFFEDTAGGNGPEVNTGLSSTFQYSYCDIDPAGINAIGMITDLGGNFNANPLFALQGYDDLGTWVMGDYHLKSQVGRWDETSETWVTDAVDSLCIDMGDPNDTYDLEPDYNGNRRNVGMFGQTVQASQSLTCISSTLSADLTGDCKVDIEDFAEFAAQWLMCSLEPAEFCL